MNKHDQLREILIKYECKEFGDCIIDEICNLFDYPNTLNKEANFMVNMENLGYNLNDINEFLQEHYENLNSLEYNETKFKEMYEVEE